jgi:hypothetical protein
VEAKTKDPGKLKKGNSAIGGATEDKTLPADVGLSIEAKSKYSLVFVI